MANYFAFVSQFQAQHILSGNAWGCFVRYYLLYVNCERCESASPVLDCLRVCYCNVFLTLEQLNMPHRGCVSRPWQHTRVLTRHESANLTGLQTLDMLKYAVWNFEEISAISDRDELDRLWKLRERLKQFDGAAEVCNSTFRPHTHTHTHTRFPPNAQYDSITSVFPHQIAGEMKPAAYETQPS